MACGIRQSNNLFRLLIKVNEIDKANAASVNSLKTWHKCLGHINCQSLHKMTKKNIVNGVSLSNNDKFFCESCQFGKQHRLLFKSERKIERDKEIRIYLTFMCLVRCPRNPSEVQNIFYFLRTISLVFRVYIF